MNPITPEQAHYILNKLCVNSGIGEYADKIDEILTFCTKPPGEALFIQNYRSELEMCIDPSSNDEFLCVTVNDRPDECSIWVSLDHVKQISDYLLSLLELKLNQQAAVELEKQIDPEV